MEEKNFELEIAPLTEEELDAVDGGAGESRSAWRSARCVVKKNYLAEQERLEISKMRS